MLQFIERRWKGVVPYHFLGGTLRLNELPQRVPNVTQRMLKTQLRELEADGFVAEKSMQRCRLKWNIVSRSADDCSNL